MFFTRISIQNPVFATMMMVALVVLGIFSYQRLGVDQLPDIEFPVTIVVTPYPGASAEAVEEDVTKPVEEAINGVSGIRTIRSFSYEGGSTVVAEFELKTDVRLAIQDVRDKVSQVKLGFKKDVGEPSVQKADNDNDQPIMYLSLRSEARSLRELSDIAKQIVVKRLQGAKGVGAINVNGEVERELSITLDPQKMTALGISIDQVINAIRIENQDVPAGALANATTERMIRLIGRLRSPEDFSQIIVARRAGAPVTLSQVAIVRDAPREERSISTVDGKRQISINIRKSREGNTIEVAEDIRKTIDKIKEALPKDTTLELTFDRSVFIKDSVSNVKTTIFEGALLTIAIVFIFLRSWRSTVITGLTLPISVLATFIAMYAFGFTLNFLTLMALSLSIGILIDDAIVVRENIVRHLAMGKSHKQAAFEATQEIGLAVMATTFSIVAVFIPVAFMGGIIGKFFYQFGITVAFAVMVSLFVSFTLDPMLSSVWHDPPSRWMQRGPVGWLLAKSEACIEWTHRVYDRVLRRALAYKKTTLLIAFLVFLSSFAFPMLGLVKSEFIPETDEGQVNARIETPVGSSLEYTMGKAAQVEAVLREFPEVKKIFTDVYKNNAYFELQLVDKKLRKRSQKEMSDAVRDRLANIAGIETRVGWNKPIRLFILGQDVKTLQTISDQVMAKAKEIDGLVDIENSLKPTNPTVEIRVNRQLASDLGVSSAQIGAAVRAMFAGETIGQWFGPDGENHTIRLLLPKALRTNIGDLDRVYLTTNSVDANGQPRMVQLKQIAEFLPSLGERSIQRRDLQRQIQISIGVNADADVGALNNKFRDAVKTIDLPAGYRFSYGGSQQDMQDSLKHAVSALSLAIVFIYLILASQFRSFLQPLAIMASLPLSLIGVFAALAIFRSSLNLFSVIGFIMLMGLVTKNAILLVDFANQMTREGKSREEALLDAGQVRLRPILMTTAAMIFGMLPLALALGPGSEQQSPMAHAIIGGIITSTVLTLVVVPVLYIYFDRLGEWGMRVFGSRKSPESLAQGVPVAGDD
jgi:hydrophobic/amphiphilic exporter-1 (mainly G- bacteria), HAE1 family